MVFRFVFVHIVFMICGFGVFIPLAIFIARYRVDLFNLRTPHESQASKREPAWLNSHTWVIFVGTLFVLLGWTIAFVSVESHMKSWHGCLGSLLVFVLIFVQPHFAYDDGPVKVRHRRIGYVIGMAAFVNIILGATLVL